MCNTNNVIQNLNENNQNEIWKDIKGYEGYYQVSNLGNVKTLHANKGHKIKLLSIATHPRGYRQVNLYKDGKHESLLVHRLVAAAFIPNPNNYNEVNHIDENKCNNNADNLEWISHAENCRYGTISERISKANKGRKRSDETKAKMKESQNLRAERERAEGIRCGRVLKKISQYDLNGNFIRDFDSLYDAVVSLGFTTNRENGYGYSYASNICHCCKGIQKQHMDSYGNLKRIIKKCYSIIIFRKHLETDVLH